MAQPDSDVNFEPTIIVSGKAPQNFADAMAHYLVALEGDEPGKRVEVGEAALTLGRDPKQSLVFSDSRVSRVHARVSIVNDRLVVEDLGSTNGTFVDMSRITEPATVRDGGVVQVGSQVLRYERRSRREVEMTRELAHDLRKARHYVLSLLPEPITAGSVRTDWTFVPSAQLGGDAFGYYWLSPTIFVFYLIDVSGHGVGAAMHTVTVLNVLRQRALPGVNFEDPSQVLSSLNDRFQMDSHDGMLLTMWYGVYRTDERRLTYSSAGHHPAYIVPADRNELEPVGARGMIMGAMPGSDYPVHIVPIAPGSRLYLFSDGVFEIMTDAQERWSISDFLPLLLEPGRSDLPETERLYQRVRQAAAVGPLEDDVSLLVVSFL